MEEELDSWQGLQTRCRGDVGVVTETWDGEGREEGTSRLLCGEDLQAERT